MIVTTFCLFPHSVAVATSRKPRSHFNGPFLTGVVHPPGARPHCDFWKQEIASQREWRINARPCNELSDLPKHFVTSALRSNLATARSLTVSRQHTAKESDIATFPERLPSASTSLGGWDTVKNATTAPQVALDAQLAIDQRVTAIEEEWEIPKESSGHISHSPGVFSTTRNDVQKNIVAKAQDILSPICRLPVETLRHIFEEAVDTEAAEWFVNPTRRPTPLKSATRIAGTCRFWRTIAQRTPRMWNRLRTPIQVESSLSKKVKKYRTIGVEAFWGLLQLCGGIPLEVTIPDGHTSLQIPDLTSLNVDRLNLYDVTQFDWSPREPPFPSPRHLWVGQGKFHGFSYTTWLPSFLISRTTTITAYNITLSIPERCTRVTQLVLCGLQDMFRLTSLLKSLPCLIELDALGVFTKANHERGHSALTHQKLRILRIHESCMHALEYYLADGLQLPSLRCFGVACRMRLVPWCYTPSSFPWVSTQLPTTVTHLEVHGEHRVATPSTNDLIGTFYRIDTISTYGKAIGAVLCVLSQIRDMPEGEMSSGEEGLPSTIQELHIHDYLGDGEDLHPALHQIYNNTNPIKVFFKDCPNILPTVRREFMHAQTTIARPSH